MPSNRVPAWDVPTRMFKWSLVAAVAAAWASNKYAAPHPEWHKWSGYAALTLAPITHSGKHQSAAIASISIINSGCASRRTSTVVLVGMA